MAAPMAAASIDEGGLSAVEGLWGERSLMTSRRSGSWGLGPDNVFARSSNEGRVDDADDEEALMWAALEKLPTYNRLQTALIEQMKGSRVKREQVDLRNIGPEQRAELLKKVFPVSAEEDNLKFIQKYRDRLDRVGIRPATIEVRYENLSVEANCYVGGRSLPTLYNSLRNNVEMLLSSLGIPVTKKTKISILKGISGIIKPGRMTLLLGPPSSGKTTMLLALAGKLDSELKVQGKVTYNGYNLDEFVPARTAAYISQNDLHQGELTVRETLDFSAKCQGVGQRYNLLTELLKREKEQGIHPEPDIDFFMKAAAHQEGASDLLTEYMFKILALEICADTIVGDAMRRGISGGQKKRVTTGEMVVGPMHTLFMDEISTGLDTSTTFQIIKCLSDIVHLVESTLLISLLQPAPEVFNLFDDVVILSEGHVVYHGPVGSVLDFFETCGFKCPRRKGTADFLQEVTSRKDQQQYWADGNTEYKYFTVTEFAEAFKKYHLATGTEEELAVPFDRSKSHPAALVFEKSTVPTKVVFKAVFEREKLLMKRNSFVYVFKSSQICIMATIAMSVFFRTRMHRRTLNDAQVFSGALFYGVVNVMFNGAAELIMTISRLPVFYRQRDILFFPAWTFSVSTYILRIPISLLESLVWICITYYAIGFAPEPGRFFRQLLLFFWVHQMSSGLFRFIAGVCRTTIVTQTGGSFAILIMFALGGFLIPRTSIKPWWIWGYWISPLAYAQNGIDVNEYLAPEWDKDPDSRGRSLGVRFLESAGLFSTGYWYWISLGVMIGYTFLFNFLFTLAITYLNPLGKSKSMISKEMLDEQQANLSGESGTLMPTKSSLSRTERGSLRERLKSLSRRKAGDESGQDVRTSGLSASSGPTPRPSEDSTDGLTREPPKGMVLPFQPLSISFDDVNYSLDMPPEMKQHGEVEDRLQLLRGVTGAFRPGVLTALVGVSGAGKSTLMDVLAGRKTGGYIEGDIRISGFPKKQTTFARIAGYCEQNDIHSPRVTVHESLIYSAWLRLSPEVDDNTKSEFVEQVMELVELLPIRYALVGLPGVTGLSTEQRKRLTIAVELVANPSIIFMDEPTSGLDARAAAIVMRTVRNTVDTGRTVVCTIHQPSIDIFEAFDELLLMKRGGRVIYAGPLGRHSRHLVEYFEAIEGVPQIREGYNPATWMLEVSSMGVEQRLGVDFGDLYCNSDLFQRNKEIVKELSTPVPNAKDLWFPTEHSQPFWSQFLSCIWKQNLTYWRSPEYNLVRLLFTVVSATLFGTIFWRLGPKRDSQNNIFSVMGAMYGATLFIGTNNSSSVQPVVSTERAVFYREKAAGMFSAIPYAMAQVFIEIPYVLVQVILYALITYSMIGLEWTAPKFFWYVFFMYCTFLLFTFYGMMAVSLSPNDQLAAVLSAFFYTLFNLFSGFLVSKERLPKWWIWYYYICPTAWTLNGLISSQFGDVETNLTQTDGSIITVRQFVKNYFGFEHSFLPVVAAVLVAFPVLFASLFMFAIKYFNFQKR